MHKNKLTFAEYVCIKVIQVKKQRPFLEKYFDMMSSTVLLLLNFYLQKFILYNAKINYSDH